MYIIYVTITVETNLHKMHIIYATITVETNLHKMDIIYATITVETHLHKMDIIYATITVETKKEILKSIIRYNEEAVDAPLISISSSVILILESSNLLDCLLESFCIWPTMF